jgi:hypothetical protein
MNVRPVSRIIDHLLIAGAFAIFAGTASAAVKDACTVITSADAEAVLGEPVGPPQPATRSSGSGDGSECKFRSAQGKALSRKSVSITVTYTADDLSGTSGGISSNLQSAGFKNVHDVSGVGDRAVWGVTSMLGKAMDELTVLKGKHTMLIIITIGLQDETAALDRAKALAAKILPKT